MLFLGLKSSAGAPEYMGKRVLPRPGINPDQEEEARLGLIRAERYGSLVAMALIREEI